MRDERLVSAEVLLQTGLMRRAGRLAVLLLPAVFACGAAAQSAIQYDRDIAPILAEKCGDCHNADDARGKLNLDTQADLLKGGASGASIVPGKSGDSLLIKRLLGLTDEPRMPKNADPLPQKTIDLLRAWIDQGKFDQAAISASAAKPKAMVQSVPAVVQTATTAASRTGSGENLFAGQVRPILAERCYSCHGAARQENGLRLDSLAAILKGGDSGSVVVPGSSAKSHLLRRLRADEKPRMPFGAPPLAEDELQAIQRWIDSGAQGPDSNAPVAVMEAPKHWAYIKPVRPLVPVVKDAKWVRNPIDTFVLARLEKEGLKPSPEADKRTLIRRVYLDLIGLPPTPKEVDAFLADNSADAYEKVVDRLLAMPQYGERWARPWLDLARYADSNGYEKDAPRTMWEFRDWVIRALNADMSFREFTIEQIAGDMLPNPTKDQLIASGFQRNSMLYQEGGVNPYEYYFNSQVDRVNVTASVWLGATLSCAQCHNHKYDPFTQKDYYRFLAFYNNNSFRIQLNNGYDRSADEGTLELPTPEQEKKSKELRAKIDALRAELNTSTPQLEAAQAAWEAAIRESEKQWTSLKPEQYASAGGATLKLLPDSSILAGGANPETDVYTITAKTDLAGVTGLRLEALPDASLPAGGPGRDADGNFFLSDLDVDVAPANDPKAMQQVKWKSAFADEWQDGYEVRHLLKKEGEGWSIAALGDKPLRRQAVLTPDKPFGFLGGTVVTIHLRHNLKRSARNLGRFRVSLTTTENPQFIVEMPAKLRPVTDVAAAERTGAQAEALAAAYRSVAPLLDPVRAEKKAFEKSLEDLHIGTAMVLAENPGYARPSANLRERGSFYSPAELVYADVPAALPPLKQDEMPNRLGLAQWLVSNNNPLTARVTVNHFWETIFGRGIVETAEDFGLQGSLPSNPQLLDWLATEFMSQGWSMKKIQREMVTSATYRQSSKVTPELLERDPYNDLYARGPRFRVEAEMVHDIALAEAGLLSPKMYGPSVYPYQPDGIWDVAYANPHWPASKGEDRFRRALYTFVRRSAPYPSLTVFDATSREQCIIRRVRTDTPVQALTTLNDPFFFDAARALAKRMTAEGGATPESRIAYGFELTASRRPTASELNKVLAFYKQQLATYQRDPEAARKAIAFEREVGRTQTTQSASAEKSAAAVPPEAKADPELAALTMVANVLLNTDEAITKE